MSYIENLIKDAAKIAKDQKFTQCASYIMVGDPRLAKITGLICDVKGSGVGGHDFPAYTQNVKDFLNKYPNIQWHRRAPCYASFQRFGSSLNYSIAGGYNKTVKTVLKNLRIADKKGVLPKASGMLSRAIDVRAPHYILIYPTWMRSPTEESIQVYNLLMKESWMQNMFGEKGNTYAKHVNKCAVLKVGDHTMQQVFGAAMLLRMPLEHARFVGPAFTKLLEHGFAPKIAARLSMYLSYDPILKKFIPGPTSHSFTQPRFTTEAVWKSLLKEEWEPSWSADKKPWKVSPTNQWFELDKATTGNKELDGRSAANLWMKERDDWAYRYTFDIDKLKEWYEKVK